MGLGNLVHLAWLFVAVCHTQASMGNQSDECFDNQVYICDDKTAKEKSCDCKNNDTCYFKFVIENSLTEKIENQLEKIITVNGDFQGPTLIVKENATVVVDVFNNMKQEATSIHWHGMHQYDVPWVDGVGQITQWSIKPGRKFRYIFKASPSGSFWYHSHVGLQRGKGLFGALIIRENSVPHFPNIGKFEDEPDKHTLVFLDFKRKTPEKKNAQYFSGSKKKSARKAEEICYPDGSRVPRQEGSAVPIMNGVLLPENGVEALRKRRSTRSNHHANPQISSFYVELGKTYRFRLIGAMEGTAYRFSIDDHKLIVIATDGYLVEPFETDYITIHSGERYDFLLHANQTNSVWFLMRIETLAMYCVSKKRLGESGLAFLGYADSPSDEFLASCNSNEENPRGCNKTLPCQVLNCPFKDYTNENIGLHCYHVDELKLLNPTPANSVPSSTPDRTWFFDFEKPGYTTATVNGKQFEIPDIALQVGNYVGKINQCGYDAHCLSPNNTKCVHIVDIPNENYKKSMRFVLSSLGGKNGVFTHPIHLHGHSFLVTKIGYPTYFANGKIDERTADLTPSECGGPPSWTQYGGPCDIKTPNEKTVRKDTIIVPAGGYVVIEFIADNPGYWFMHCHIDYHLHYGMAVVIRELKRCQNKAPIQYTINDADTCWTIEEFNKKRQWQNPCDSTCDTTDIVNDNPDIAHDNPDIVHDNPDIVHDNPDIAHDNSDIVHDNPDIVHDNPDIAHDNPDIAHDNPEITHDKPDIAHDNPEITHDNPHIAHDNPHIAHDNPDIAHDNPDIAHDNPDIAHDNPDIAHDNPDIAHDNPDIVHDNAEIVHDQNDKQLSMQERKSGLLRERIKQRKNLQLAKESDPETDSRVSWKDERERGLKEAHTLNEKRKQMLRERMYDLKEQSINMSD